ncbi:MAG TPA: oxidoreductase [Terriglobales bacterium]|nr:oxidoreductase [Terriglobales bacterium]
MVNVGLVGFGFAGSIFHAPIISAVPGLKLRAILQRTGNNAAAAFPNAMVVRSLDELLGIEEIKLIVIATPNTSHYSIAKQCLVAGREVVVDKPFTTTYAEAEELVRLAQQRGRLLTVYQNRRFDGDFRTLQELLGANRLGRVVLFETHFDRFRLELRPNAWRECPQPGSGIFFDLGVHLLDQALLLFGHPQALTADIRSEREGARVDDAFDVTLHYPRRLVLLRSSMLALAPDLRFLLRGEQGTYIKYGLDPQEDALKRGEVPRDDTWGREERDKWGVLYRPNSSGIEAETIPTHPGNYCLFYGNVRDAILGNAQIEVTHEQMLDVIYGVELARKSSEEKRTLEWRRG